MPSSAFSLLPAFLGMAAVLQAGLIRRISAQFGWVQATLLNTVVVLLCVLAAQLATGRKLSVDGFRLWFLLPGLLGFCLITIGPWAIARWGAAHTFSLLIAGQLAMSLLWDHTVEGFSPSPVRVGGVFVVAFGAWLATSGK